MCNRAGASIQGENETCCIIEISGGGAEKISWNSV